MMSYNKILRYTLILYALNIFKTSVKKTKKQMNAKSPRKRAGYHIWQECNLTTQECNALYLPKNHRVFFLISILRWSGSSRSKSNLELASNAVFWEWFLFVFEECWGGPFIPCVPASRGGIARPITLHSSPSVSVKWCESGWQGRRWIFPFSSLHVPKMLILKTIFSLTFIIIPKNFLHFS